MKLSSVEHPSLASLSDHCRAVSGAGSVADADIATHVASCRECQESLAFLESLSGGVAQLPAPVPSDALRARALQGTSPSTQTSAIRTIDVTRTPLRDKARWWTASAVAAALAMMALGSLFWQTPAAEAGAAAGSMDLSTNAPRNGERVTVRFRAGASLSRFPVLTLRGRVRTVNSDAYVSGIPVVTLGRLTRQTNGDYTGDFTLPDSIVFASLAVEDSAATEIDDHGGRTWEVQRADASGKVPFESIEQRARDLMGRNWEEISASTARMVAEYPNDLRAWSWLRSSQGWSGLSQDSVQRIHRPHVAEFDRRLRSAASVPPAMIGQMYWYARDSILEPYWRERLLREAPRTSFAIQMRLFAHLDSLRASKDTAATLRALDRLWSESTEDRLDQVSGYTTPIAIATGDTALIRRWTDRVLSTAGTSPSPARVRSVAMDFVRVPALRAEGLERLRSELRRLNDPTPLTRNLDETETEFRARIDRSRRATLAALGRGLVTAGQPRAALDTLTMAAESGWNVDVIRSVRTASLAAGDTATSLTMAARLVVDPRTTSAERDSLSRMAIARAGATAWNTMIDAQRREFVQRTLAAAKMRTIARDVPVRGLDGRAGELRSLTKGHVTVVAFWSRFCGPAIDALPALHAVAARLARDGVQTQTVLEEANASPALSAFLKQQRMTLPVWLDAAQGASQAFNQWSTPSFYVLDSRGRIMFEPTSDVDELLVYATAVRLSESSR